jgi:hypothetical protein
MIMEGIKSDVDVISYNYSCDIPLDDKVGFSRKVSIKNKNVVDFENKILNVTPDPKNPIKREIVNKIKFDDVSHSEEYLFKIDVGAHLKTEYKIEEDIYQILNRSGESYDFKTRYNLKPKKLM